MIGLIVSIEAIDTVSMLRELNRLQSEILSSFIAGCEPGHYPVGKETGEAYSGGVLTVKTFVLDV